MSINISKSTFSIINNTGCNSISQRIRCLTSFSNEKQSILIGGTNDGNLELFNIDSTLSDVLIIYLDKIYI